MQEETKKTCQYSGCNEVLAPLHSQRGGHRKYCIEHKGIAEHEAIVRSRKQRGAKRKKERAAMKANAPKTKLCITCKKAKIPNTVHHKYCAPCRKKADEVNKANRKRNDRENTRSLRLLEKQPALAKEVLTEAQIAEIEAEQARINKEARRREDLRMGFKPDPGRSVPKEEWAAIVPTITPIHLITDSYHYEASRSGI